MMSLLSKSHFFSLKQKHVYGYQSNCYKKNTDTKNIGQQWN
jgi:hypothetical protein